MVNLKFLAFFAISKLHTTPVHTALTAAQQNYWPAKINRRDDLPTAADAAAAIAARDERQRELLRRVASWHSPPPLLVRFNVVFATNAPITSSHQPPAHATQSCFSQVSDMPRLAGKFHIYIPCCASSRNLISPATDTLNR